MLAAVASSVPAQTQTRNKRPEEIAVRIAVTYKAKSLGSFDAARLIRGSLHNQLYLDEILYGYRNGRRYVREIRRWNGE